MKITFRVEDLDCANCASKLEAALGAIEGVNKATVSFIAQKILLDIDDSIADTIKKDVKKAAKKSVPDCTVV